MILLLSSRLYALVLILSPPCFCAYALALVRSASMPLLSMLLERFWGRWLSNLPAILHQVISKKNTPYRAESKERACEKKESMGNLDQRQRNPNTFQRFQAFPKSRVRNCCQRRIAVTSIISLRLTPRYPTSCHILESPLVNPCVINRHWIPGIRVRRSPYTVRMGSRRLRDAAKAVHGIRNSQSTYIVPEVIGGYLIDDWWSRQRDGLIVIRGILHTSQH